jgi:Methyltransferase domain
MSPSPGPDEPATTLRICTVCGQVATTFKPGPNGRPDAACPGCGGLERHRFVVLALDALLARGLKGVVLDVAPMAAVAKLLRASAPAGYVSMDFDPAADGRSVGLAASITDLPLRSGSVGLMVCMHVLEHVPDDRSAMREMARVLAEEGIAVVQVPWRAGPTEEDPAASVEERIRRFGQADHVRIYGDEFEDRLRESGLQVSSVRPGQLLDAETCAVLGVSTWETLWLCARPGAPDPVDVLRAGLAGALAAALERVGRRALAPSSAGRPARAGGSVREQATDRALASLEVARRWARRHPAVRDNRLARAAARSLPRSTGRGDAPPGSRG